MCIMLYTILVCVCVSVVTCIVLHQCPLLNCIHTLVMTPTGMGGERGEGERKWRRDDSIIGGRERESKERSNKRDKREGGSCIAQLHIH